jgi:hypothetical protein
MKKLFVLMIGLACWAGQVLIAQESIGIGTTSPNQKAILDISSTTKGILIPRMNTTQRTSMSLSGPDFGMIVYDTSLDAAMFWNGSSWQYVGKQANFWKQNGTNLYYLDGNVGIGLTVPIYKLQVQNTNTARSLQLINEYDGTNNKYGIYAYVSDEGTGDKHGVRTQVNAHPTDASSVHGFYTVVSDNNSPANMFGVRASVGSGGTGTHYGLFGSAYGANNRGIHASNTHADGWAGYFQGRGYFSDKVGLGVEDPSHRLQIDAEETRAIDLVNNYSGSSTVYGIRAQINDVSTGTKYGVLADINLPATHTSTVYGLYATIEDDDSPSGTHYGVYSYTPGEGNRAVYGYNLDDEGWAGYFYGRGYFYKDLDIRNKLFLRPTGYNSGASLIMVDNDGTETIKFHANQSSTNGAEILLYDDAGNKTIELDAEWGDGGPGRVVTGELQITAGSDLAEYFDLIEENNNNVEPGMIVSIDPASSGKLILCKEAYDQKIAGVISGANGVNPGMLMGHEKTIADGDFPVAIAGRVYVHASTINGKIQPGDLLTSSDIPGTAMKVTDYEKARGAVLGKAMTKLSSSDGFVLMLISLQ